MTGKGGKRDDGQEKAGKGDGKRMGALQENSCGKEKVQNRVGGFE